MKIKFDSNQEYQLDAIQATVDVFDGQPVRQGEHEIRLDSLSGHALTELGTGNNLLLDDTRILQNVQSIQAANNIQPPVDDLSHGMNFSIEMETGTGKTYVYLRSIYELNKAYDFTKFVIVVPSVAIREGVLKNIQLTEQHFRNIYGSIPVDYWVYDSKQVSRLRGYANSNHLQILIMNIDAFNKDLNVINQENDKLSGRKPIEFLQATNPIAIIDEPQNMESEQARAAIDSLNPLCTFRYSATHRNVYNLLYRLDPVRAYDLRLVKRIEVDAILDEPDFNKPYIEVKSVKASRTRITAKLLIDVDSADGPKRKTISVTTNGTDLFEKSNQRPAYDGYVVTEIDAGNEYISFANGVTLYAGQTHGSNTDAIMKAQIRETVREHFEKELRIHRKLPNDKKMKVLSLFFIDRVANYYPEDGKIRRWFEDAYEELSAKTQYEPLNPLPVDQVHDGYFAVTNTGDAKDSRGEAKTKADEQAFELIMRDKERLLDRSEPLRFIFSHSALREGWDNPNVFQICTLNETKSEIKKRQEIGRGLRLPVREDGTRCFEPAYNRLTVIANESYEDFAQKLQNEIEEECGIQFGGRIANKRERRKATLIPDWQLNDDFQELWKRIQHRTRYSVAYDTQDLVATASNALKQMPQIKAPKLTAQKAGLDITDQGVTGQILASRPTQTSEPEQQDIPDLLTYLQRETELTRGTLANILIQSDRLTDIATNPQQFLDQSLTAIRYTLNQTIVDGIKYEKVNGQTYEMLLFEQNEIEGYINRMVDVQNSIYDCVEVESNVERDFAQTISNREDIKLVIKLPDWFRVETPLGTYNPDWAIVKQEDEKLYLVRETKSTTDQHKLRPSESQKIRCGKAHFDALEVDFDHVASADEI
ncbi:MAG: DEAD/DEAH box helicase [Planctomycetota bacterium]|mgnify:CR=1 FL=1|nr:MAG: DEAD/DEAH box helicase [Planctomycetota bacterium]REJ90352.1 MAG: DEAD/DEAH box helicase [Planctomycetota bacterium]